MFDISQKVIAITGAGSGIGLALTRLCLSKGARVAASDVNPAELELLAGSAGDKLLVSTLDVRDRVAVAQWAQTVSTQFGGCDAIVNNAGVSLSSRVQTMRRENLEWIMDINFWGVVNGVEAFLPLLEKSKSARIVNLSSLFGLMAVPSQSAYNASKFAVRGYSEAIRQDLRDTAIKVVTVHPGGVKTNIVRNGKHFNSLDGAETNMEATADMFAKVASTTPEKAAETIFSGLCKGKPRVLIGRDAFFLDKIQRLLPAIYDRLLVPLSVLGSRRLAIR